MPSFVDEFDAVEKSALQQYAAVSRALSETFTRWIAIHEADKLIETRKLVGYRQQLEKADNPENVAHYTELVSTQEAIVEKLSTVVKQLIAVSETGTAEVMAATFETMKDLKDQEENDEMQIHVLEQFASAIRAISDMYSRMIINRQETSGVESLRLERLRIEYDYPDVSQDEAEMILALISKQEAIISGLSLEIDMITQISESMLLEQYAATLEEVVAHAEADQENE